MLLVNQEDHDLISKDIEIFIALKQYRLMDLNLKSVNIIRDRLNLAHFFSFFENFNCASLKPYHNSYHAYCMVNNCYEGAYHNGIRDVDAKPLIVAALFHDFNHSGGYEKDIDLNQGGNISSALAGLEMAQKYATAQGTGLTDGEFYAAKEAIKVTQFPFLRRPVTLNEKIIRDADLMQPYESDDIVLYKQFRGLITELIIDKQVVISEFEFSTEMRKFLDDQKWFTKWAEDKAILRNWESTKYRLQSLFTKFRN